MISEPKKAEPCVEKERLTRNIARMRLKLLVLFLALLFPAKFVSGAERWEIEDKTQKVDIPSDVKLLNGAALYPVKTPNFNFLAFATTASAVATKRPNDDKGEIYRINIFDAVKAEKCTMGDSGCEYPLECMGDHCPPSVLYAVVATDRPARQRRIFESYGAQNWTFRRWVKYPDHSVPKDNFAVFEAEGERVEAPGNYIESGIFEIGVSLNGGYIKQIK